MTFGKHAPVEVSHRAKHNVETGEGCENCKESQRSSL